MTTLNYTPPPTMLAFHKSPALARFVIGPLGSAKTFGVIMELLMRSVQQAPDGNGIRPTRFSITRNTLPQIKTTILNDIRALFDEAGIIRYKVSESTIYLDFPLDDGTKVQSEWLLVPIETTEDTRKLLSLQLTGAWCSEFRELEYEIIAAILGRVGRYPSPARVRPTWQGLVCESNPFSEGSDWYDNLVLDLPDRWEFFRQPGGRSENAENIENLPDEYYERLVQGMDEQWVATHVDAEFGDDMSGQAVWGRAFDWDFHTADDLVVNHQLPIMVAMDLGRTPTALITQMSANGRLIVLEEITSEDMGLNMFLGELLLPRLNAEEYRVPSRMVVADPAGRQKSQLDEESAFDVYKRHGLLAYPAITNDIKTRLRAVEGLLMQNRGGKAALTISRQGCPELIKAIRHNYRYARKKTGSLDDKPEKKHPISDLADALQYACLSANADLPAKMVRHHTARPARRRVSAAGWT